MENQQKYCTFVTVMREVIRQYIEGSSIPRYAAFDAAHREDHARAVIERALEMGKGYDIDPEMLYVAAACHDLGLEVDRKTHHLESGRIIRSDEALRQWFTPEQVETIAQAAEDHRASAQTPPRSIYGCLVAEADRMIEPETIIRRTVQFGFAHYPELDREAHWQRTVEHLNEKYAEGGYLKLLIPGSPNEASLARLREIIKDHEQLRSIFDRCYNSQIKVCVGLSGGVDSSVAAYLLKQQGYDVFAMFMQNWHDADSTLHGDCEWEEDRFVAEMVARKIGIPFYFVDLSKQYRQRVVDYMFDEYAKGRTPNPDVLCNREIKFDAFLQVAGKYGAQYVATGHYCRKEVLPGGTCRILEGTDPNKDQTYFLCQLTQEQLAGALFPIGGIVKPEVRRIAKEADLPSAEKKDSQGICFVGKVDLPTFLKQKLTSVEGDVIEIFDPYYDVDPLYQWQQETLTGLLQEGRTLERTVRYAPEEKVLTTDGEPLGESPYQAQAVEALSDEQLQKLATPLHYDITFETETYRSGKHHIKKTRYKENPCGRIVGRHEGAQFYTIGQRKGLGIGGHANPVFVIATDTEANRVYVGEGHHHKGLSRFCLRVAPDEIHWIRTDLAMQPGEIRRYRVRIRYRQPLQSATLLQRESGLYILFDAPQRGISPGQFAVWYDGEEMLGSGVI